MFHLGMTGKIIIVDANRNKYATSFYYKSSDYRVYIITLFLNLTKKLDLFIMMLENSVLLRFIKK